MRNLVRAELLRLRTTRAVYGWAAAAAVGVVLSVAVAIQLAGQNGQPALDTSQGIRHVLAGAASNTIIVLFLGILAMAGEFRHDTATATFLVTPDRARVVRAKLAASALVGLVVAAASAALTLAIALPWMAAKGVDVPLVSAHVGLVLAGALAANALYGVVGVGLAALIRNQTAAIGVSLVWIMVAEALLVGLVPHVGRWLPGGAANALTSVATAKGGLLPMWAGGLLFAAYGASFALAGTRAIVRRDVT